MSCSCGNIFCGLGCVAGKTLDSVASQVKSCAGGCASVDTAWEDYKSSLGKVYLSDDDEAERQAIWRQAAVKIDQANAMGGAKFSHNYFSDRKPEESHQRGYKRNLKRERSETRVLSVEKPQRPRSIDWRLTEAVTPIKNQGQCGSCWAFSATETIESHFILGEGLTYGVAFSPQQVTSCTTADYGCGGGEPMDAYDHIMTVPGLTNEWNWPYVQSMTEQTATANCTAGKEAMINGTLEPLEGAFAQLSGYNFATPPCYDAGCYHQNLTALADAVEVGPVSICVVAQMWDYYESGVMTAEQCGPMGDEFVDHCVQLVGFDRKQNYWIVRNSWGTEWGEDGNIYLQMDMNSCGLADEATVPIIANSQSERHLPAMLERAMGMGYSSFSV